MATYQSTTPTMRAYAKGYQDALLHMMLALNEGRVQEWFADNATAETKAAAEDGRWN